MKKVLFIKKGKTKLTNTKEQLSPGKNEVLVNIKACGLNMEDVYQKKPSFLNKKVKQMIPGRSIAGDITSVGEGVDEKIIDNSIIAFIPYGGLSEQIIIPLDYTFPLPKGMDYTEATTLLISYMTAFQLVFQNCRVVPHETILIHDIHNGYGMAILNLLKKSGVRIIGTTPKKNHYALEEYGINLLVDTAEKDWTKKISDFTNNDGLDFVFDQIGGSITTESIALLKIGGTIGFFGSPTNRYSYTTTSIMDKNIAMFGVNNSTIAENPENIKRIINQILFMVNKRVISPVLYKNYTIFQSQTAFNNLILKQNIGEVVIQISS